MTELNKLKRELVKYSIEEPERQAMAAPDDEPHQFVGVLYGVADRPCERCGKPDRNPIHKVERATWPNEIDV